MLNVFKELKDKTENFSREVETIKGENQQTVLRIY